MERIGEALLISLFKAGFIKTPTDSLQVIAQKDSDGMVTCGLKGGTTYENDLFLDALSEIVMPIENPRYLIARKHPYQIWAAADFHAVPNLIGRQKKTALSLLREWRWKVGRASLIYTRTEQGRKVLLKARRKSLVQKLSSRQERRTRWQ